MFYQNLVFILPSFQQFLLKRILIFSHKMVFIENELLCVIMREHARIFAATIQSTTFCAIKTFSFCGARFLNAFWHRNKVFPKDSSSKENVPLLVVFHLPYSKYKDVKICFYSCRQQNQNFLLVSHSCRSCSTRVTPVSCQYYSRVAFVLLVLHLCRSCLTLVLDQIVFSYECCKTLRTTFLQNISSGCF